MSSFKFNYIISIRNNDDLIERVMLGVLGCAGSDSHIYPVLVGHNESAEAVIDRLMARHPDKRITKLPAPDGDEIRPINSALAQIPQDGDGFNIILQDDILLTDSKTEEKNRSHIR